MATHRQDEDRPEKTANPFSTVPYEIAAHILSFVPRPDLATVCLVNQSLCHCAEPILCSDIAFKWARHGAPPPITSLLRKLFRRPELFDCVDVLSLTGHSYSMSGEDSLPPVAVTESTLVEFEHIIKKLDVPFAGVWVRRLREGSMDAFSALLIAHLSKVRRLTIDDSHIRRLDLIGKVLQSKAIGQNLPRFERLKLIVYFHRFGPPYQPTPQHRFDEVMALFQIPTISHLATQMGSTEIFHWPAGEPNLSCLTSLDLGGCCAAFMPKILALTGNLKSLAWQWQYIAGTDDPWMTTNLDLDEIISVLSSVKDTLEKLQIRFDVPYEDYPGDDVPTMDISGSFGGLVNFNRLTELKVPIACLADFGVQPQSLDRYVPRSVEKLSLFVDMLETPTVVWIPNGAWPADDYFARLFRDFAKRCPTRLPGLHLVQIIDDYAYFERLGEILAQSHLSVDIDFVRHNSPLWELSVDGM
ncbi:unnamed protein product [Clonostachys rosea]|uniref:F-box domain-containing protein n=1 Tax=Bionectria ochroleuca TaxID=29856 RepID=A0ABY6UNY3_BIOOC|nr:unnamed protein product [Clonostachys rosea]